MDERLKRRNWDIGRLDKNGYATMDQVKCALLMDIRDEIQELNSLLHCRNFTQIPAKLDAIRRNTTRKERKGT